MHHHQPQPTLTEPTGLSTPPPRTALHLRGGSPSNELHASRHDTTVGPPGLSATGAPVYSESALDAGLPAAM
ncbi:hypothetical protein CMUS01_07103 [Colletotrichum musicola]|uniref:Uncharacterized protein n=1 Tax=Colletotrichum musicola TaxID=2175873 RepID=A0A8H6KJL0_9PEZI|nr:hypothetical protein CMUS01_07103 [Colletotrichum musicola]